VAVAGLPVLLGDCLPGDDAGAVGVAASRSVVGEQGEADGFGGAFGDGLMATVPVEVRGGVAGVGGVDLDGGVAEFPGELRSEHVEGSLGGAVAEELGEGEGVVGVALLGDGAEAAGVVAEARGGLFPPLRTLGLGAGARADDVGAEGGFDGFERGGGGQAVGVGDDSGVVDEDVKMAEVLVDGGGCGGDGGGFGDVDGEEADVEAFSA